MWVKGVLVITKLLSELPRIRYNNNIAAFEKFHLAVLSLTQVSYTIKSLIQGTSHPELECVSSGLAVIFAQSIEDMC